MEYEIVKVLKQSDKSTVQLIRKPDGEQLFIRKTLRGRHPVYQTLQKLPHPCLPVLYEVSSDRDKTVVIEEYIEGETAGSAELTEKQCRAIVRELCGVLIFLHENGIIHRDIKPSNLLIAKDGHIRLIDFDAARMPKEDAQQDTMQLGTRGYAPPEQYGFSQTDERSDIYALGVTMKQLLRGRAGKRHYRRVLSKCTSLDPDHRYRSVRQVRRALFSVPYWQTGVLCAAAAILAAVVLRNMFHTMTVREASPSEKAGLTILPAPADPHWDERTGLALWGHVPESGVGRDQVYDWRLYRCDTKTPPDLEKDEWGREGSMSGNLLTTAFFEMNFAEEFWDNGFYYYAVRASGDGITYADSPYVLSDAFEYTGEDAPRLPTPEGLYWTMQQVDESRFYFAAISNWEDYEEEDEFNAFVYTKDGEYVVNNIISRKYMLEKGWPGVRIRPEFVAEPGQSYRFAVQVMTSRPNAYKSSLPVEPCPEEAYLSPELKIPE